MNLARELSEYADELEYEDFDDETITAAKVRLIDSLACSFSSIDEQPVETVIEYAKSAPGNTTPILGGGTASAENATLANGTLVRYTDWNDSYFSKEPAHPSDNFGPLLTIAGREKKSGKELITATILAYEIQSRLCDVGALQNAGLDHVTYGLASTALSVGKLLGLPPDHLEEAINIAVSSQVSLRQIRSGEVSTWKGMAFANAARNAVFTVELVQEGITGPEPVFEGRYGLSNLLTEEITVDVDEFGSESNSYKITESSLKMYPAFQHAQSAISCAIELRENADLDVEDIRRVENETYGIAVDILDEEKWNPETRGTADHSQPYCIARALSDGNVTLEHFREEKLHDDEIEPLIDKIEIREQPKYTKQYGEKFPHFMRIHTTNDVYETEIEFPKGHPNNPLLEGELTEKFALAAPGLSRNQIAAITDLVWDLEDCSEVGDLFKVVERGIEEIRQSSG